MSTEKRKAFEFDWTEDFERELLRRLLAYRTAEKSPSDPLSALLFEKLHAADFMQQLRWLMEAHAPSLAADSDITALVDRMRTAHDGALARETEKYGGPRR